ncbi:MAG: type II toxin-antitoxin system Phd/YefM family antitoxin [Thermoanaerobaculia bacterium]
MSKAARSVPAGEFKAKCLALLDEVAETGQEVVVTKRGRAVARVSPVGSTKVKSLRGSVLREKDIVSPVAAAWNAAR